MEESKYPIIIFGDCISSMSKLLANSVDFICIDLPYGLTANKKDIPINLPALWKELTRVCKPTATIALFAQGLFYVDLVNSNRKMFRYDLVWDKVLTSGFLNANSQPLRSHEQIAIFYKNKGTYNPQMTEGKPLHGKGKRYMEVELVNNNYGDFKATEDTRKGSTEKYPKSIIRFQKPHPSKAKHRTQKSIECLEWLIKTYSNEGDMVLDCCAGSGSTGIACMNTNRKSILIDNDEYWYNYMVNTFKEL